MNKKEIRNRILDMRRSLTSKYIEDASEQIFSVIIKLDEVVKAKNILVYSNFDNEVNTAKLTGWLMFNGKNVYLPAVDSGDMYAINIKNAVLELSGFGMTQPCIKKDNAENPMSIDLVIVPGVAFDKEKNRLGFGGGYYDRFLKKTDACRIAIAFDFQIIDSIPIEEHDEKMKYIVTPEYIIK